MNDERDLLTKVIRHRALLEAALHQSNDPSHRVFLIAKMLQTVYPAHPLYAAVLRSGDHEIVGAVDQAGNPQPGWFDLLGSAIKERKPIRSLPAELKLPASSLLLEEIASGSHHFGFLVLAVPNSFASKDQALAQGLLELCAEQLATRLRLEAQESELNTLRDEVAGQVWLADVGELSGPIAHGFNNFLNVVMLHLAVLEQTLPKAQHEEIAEIRRQGTGFAALVKQFQQCRHQSPPSTVPLDLNALVASTIEALQHKQGWPGGPQLKLASAQKQTMTCPAVLDHVPIHLDCASDLPFVAGSRTDLKRLVRLLVKNAAAAAFMVGGEVILRTEANGGKVLFHVEDTGTEVEPKLLPQLFEPEVANNAQRNTLELAVCKSLVLRLQGRIRVQNRPPRGLGFVVELPIASH